MDVGPFVIFLFVVCFASNLYPLLVVLSLVKVSAIWFKSSLLDYSQGLLFSRSNLCSFSKSIQISPEISLAIVLPPTIYFLSPPSDFFHSNPTFFHSHKSSVHKKSLTPSENQPSDEWPSPRPRGPMTRNFVDPVTQRAPEEQTRIVSSPNCRSCFLRSERLDASRLAWSDSKFKWDYRCRSN